MDSGSAADVAKQAATFATEVVQGAAALAEPGRAPLELLGPPGRLWVARALRGKLAFEAWHTTESGWLFGLFGQRRIQKSADVRLVFEAVCSLDRARPIRGGRAVVGPLPGSAEADRAGMGVSLRLAGGRTARALLQPGERLGERIAMLWVDGLTDWNGQWSDPPEVPLGHALTIVHGLVLSERAGSRGASPAAERDLAAMFSAPTPLNALLRDVVAGFETVDSALGLAWPEDRRLGWARSGLEARFLLQLNSEGEIESEDRRPRDPRHWLQIDLAAALEADEDSDRIAVRVGLPDMLTRGEFHAEFLAAIRDPALRRPDPDPGSRDKLLDDAAKSLGVESHTIEAWLNDPVQDDAAYFVRLRGDDWDLVVIAVPGEGDRRALAWTVHFTVPEYPDIRPTGIKAADFLGWLDGSDDWKERDKGAQRYGRQYLSDYLGKLLTTLRALDLGFRGRP